MRRRGPQASARQRGRAAAWLLLPLVAAVAGCQAPETPALDPAERAAYVAEIEQWRAQREERLRREDGWLTLIGLHWLEAGENTFGRDPDNAIVLDVEGVPPRAGVLIASATGVLLRPAPGAGLRIGDAAAEGERELASDATGAPDLLEVGRLRMHVIERTGRFGLRVKDPQSPTRLAFTGLEYFPVDPTYRVRGRLARFAEPRKVAVPNVLGTTFDMLAPGLVELEWNGQRASLLPLVDEPDETELFLIVKDATSGHETYGAGRYLYATLEADDSVTVDFNKAYNPPCAFTPYATCPLPPPENRVATRIEAGEKSAGHH